MGNTSTKSSKSDGNIVRTSLKEVVKKPNNKKKMTEMLLEQASRRAVEA